MRDYVPRGLFAADPMQLRDWHLADDAGHPDGPHVIPDLPPLFCVRCDREALPPLELNANGFCPKCCGCGHCLDGEDRTCPALTHDPRD